MPAVGVVLENVSKSFGTFEVLKNVNLEVGSGEIFVLMGPSGSGKSVLLKHIVGLERATSGRVLVDGRDAADEETRENVRMALVFVEYRRKLRAQRKEPTIDVVEEPGLSRDELRVLQLHAKLTPGFALSTRDVAEELNKSVHEIRGALERLKKLNLLNATVGGYDGETAYTLSPAGRTLLQIRHARPRVASA